jgi:hypothetical protein
MFGPSKRKGRYQRRLREADNARQGTVSGPATHTEASNSSDMDAKAFLELAFRGISSGTTDALQPGKWERDLAFPPSDKPEASTYLEHTALDDLDKRFSTSIYLSPAGLNQVAPAIILHHGEPIDDALLVCLALNEECRKNGSGVFYHLPLRKNQEVGHACDLIFQRKKWERQEKYEWDNASWVQRLDRYRLDQTCYGALIIWSVVKLNRTCRPLKQRGSMAQTW